MAAIIGVGTQSRYRLAQEREFHKFIPREHSSSRFAPFDRASSEGFEPQASSDAALTSFAQLAATRLGAERAFISLFDSTYQYVLVEATPTLSLVGGRFADDAERLILGSCIFPKKRGICHYVDFAQHRRRSNGETDDADDGGNLIVLDVTQDNRFDHTQLQDGISDMRFFTAVPIISPRGYILGALSVMDKQARSSGPDQHQLQLLKDMAATAMDHLAMREVAVKNRRAERMIIGLGSFVEGRSTLRDSYQEAQAEERAAEASGESAEGKLNLEQQDLQELSKETGEKSLAYREKPHRVDRARSKRRETSSTGRGKTEDEKNNHASKAGIEFHQDKNTARAVIHGDGLQQDDLPTSIRNVFSRAANLLRESIGAEGVMFLDANSHRFGSLVDEKKRKVTGTGFDDQQHSDDSTGSGSDRSSDHSVTDDLSQESDGTSPKASECLGFSSSRLSSINDEEKAGRAVIVPEPLFSSLIRRYPRGKIFSYDSEGGVSEDSDHRIQKESGSDNGAKETIQEGRISPPRRKRRPAFQRYAEDLIKIFGGARNILVLPIWDSDRNRWFAGALIWTNEPHRIFTIEDELVFTSAFANNIMAEIRRIDVEVAEKAKTNLVSSITHELRNPLHGILGTADILSDTAMNALQHGMVHTVESCGRTLLDTINSLLDLTFINKYRKGDTSRTRDDSDKSKSVQDMHERQKSSVAHVALDSVLEEVSDCVFAGYCFYNHPQAPPPALTESSSRSAGQTKQADPVGPRASQITVIFDIEPNTEWDFDTHAGAWRRILMNVLGNALKYTSSGYIYLGLKSTDTRNSTMPKSLKSPKKTKRGFEVTLTVKDTGKGIGPKFLQNDLFSPFKQEDPLASGSGLGLSIVRQAVGLLGGSVEIESTAGEGTQISIHAPLTRSHTKSDSSSSNSFTALKEFTEGKKIGLLGFGETLRSQRDTSLYSSLDRMCSEWFGLQVTKLSPSGKNSLKFDFYLAIQTELDCEDTNGRDLFGLARHYDIGDTPVIVICQSPEEAHRMFVAFKNQNQTTNFEFVSQPCGPRKLARAMRMCMKRRGDEAGRRDSDELTRWVEVPQSTHLPLDIEASDPPDERMKISKRPTKDTMGTEAEQAEGDQETVRAKQERAAGEQPEAKKFDIKESTVMLVDDNDVNLQLLCAYVQKDGLKFKSGKDGAQAVEMYKADPGAYHVIVIGAFPRLPSHTSCYVDEIFSLFQL
ncbi:uncharacterized protein N7469_011434 [Penicillium citrinum]|uniref:histidine kinase n=1 Tax=Penicillium citrinum TaxID=5077 RepID=A0A9W9NFC1_PENCI|nr:uncharacterized protein N7469_011434 [Penicillium citrinum]KAJ5217809.1 hypothetical protein N7469_011434 [Penicillium citrinum]